MVKKMPNNLVCECGNELFLCSGARMICPKCRNSYVAIRTMAAPDSATEDFLRYVRVELHPCPKCGKQNCDGWPLDVGGEIKQGGCQACWETECDEKWWSATGDKLETQPATPGRTQLRQSTG